jgi:hypothetical protein
MTKVRNLQAWRHNFDGPVQWELRHDRRAIYHRIEVEGPAKTPDGEMMLVKIAHKVDLADPGVDVAVLLGKAIILRKSSKVKDPQSPELWFWNDQFWVKAKASEGIPYYNNKCYLLYRVEVDRPEKLMETLNSGYDAPFGDE